MTHATPLNNPRHYWANEFRQTLLATHAFDTDLREMSADTMSAKLRSILPVGPTTGPRATTALVVRLAAGLVFVAFGAGKFTSHASEVASFRTYGLPSPDAFVYAIGVVEAVGGVLLIAGLATRIAGLVLAGDMVGAIIVSGLGRSELISLTLAPLQLLAMLFLLFTGPGRWALDRRIADRGGDTHRP